MMVALLILSLIGVAIISVALSIVITHFLLMGIEALLPIRYPMHYETANDNENETAQTNSHADVDNVFIYPLTIRRYDLYEIIRSRISKTSANQIRDLCPNKKADANKKEYYRYINHRPPRLTQHPFPFPPIEHICAIVNKLRRRVNQSGKEPAPRRTGFRIQTGSHKIALSPRGRMPSKALQSPCKLYQPLRQSLCLGQEPVLFRSCTRQSMLSLPVRRHR